MRDEQNNRRKNLKLCMLAALFVLAVSAVVLSDATTAHAAKKKASITMSLDKAKIKEGEKVTITLKLKNATFQNSSVGVSFYNMTTGDTFYYSSNSDDFTNKLVVPATDLSAGKYDVNASLTLDKDWKCSAWSAHIPLQVIRPKESKPDREFTPGTPTLTLDDCKVSISCPDFIETESMCRIKINVKNAPTKDLGYEVVVKDSKGKEARTETLLKTKKKNVFDWVTVSGDDHHNAMYTATEGSTAYDPLPAGKYTIVATVYNSGSDDVIGEAAAQKTVKVYDPECTVKKIGNQTYKVSAKVKGKKGKYKYKIQYKKWNGKLKTLKNFSEKNTATVKLPKKSVYQFFVTIKDSEGHVYKTMRGLDNVYPETKIKYGSRKSYRENPPSDVPWCKTLQMSDNTFARWHLGNGVGWDRVCRCVTKDLTSEEWGRFAWKRLAPKVFKDRIFYQEKGWWIDYGKIVKANFQEYYATKEIWVADKWTYYKYRKHQRKNGFWVL